RVSVLAVAPGEFYRFDSAGIGLVHRALDTFSGFGGAFDAVLVGQPIQHHRRRQDHRRWISLPLPDDVGRGAVAWLEYRVAIADIGRRRHAQAADQAGSEVG